MHKQAAGNLQTNLVRSPQDEHDLLALCNLICNTLDKLRLQIAIGHLKETLLVNCLEFHVLLGGLID